VTRLALVMAIALTVLAASATPAAATFPGANGRIAFDSERDSFDFGGKGGCVRVREIYTMNPDGSDQQRLTTFEAGSGGCNTDPAYSPDGTKILFVRHAFRSPEVESEGGDFNCQRYVTGDIWVMNADGSAQTQVTSEARDSDPSWSPDGTKILFRRSGFCENEVSAAEESGGFSQSDIYSANVDGSDQQNLTPDEELCVSNREPVWSPDGTQIAFSSNRDEGWHIFVANADGSGPQNISGDNPDDHDPDWSPNSARLTFTRDGHIWVMDRNGGNQAFVTQGEAEEKQSVWSPDATMLSFAVRAPTGETEYEIAVANADGSGQHSLTAPSPLREANPNWQPVARTPGTPATPGATGGSPETPAARRDRRRPRVRVAGISQGCTASTALRVPVRINERVRRVGVRLDGRLIRRTSSRRFTVVINARRLREGRHTLRVVAVDAAGNRTTLRRPIVRCAQAEPQQAPPSFTG
jgi:Tol biopolymer transport system component